MITYKIHLIRHGVTQGNREGRYIGRTDMPLSPEGIAELLTLQEESSYPYVDAVFSSPLMRCKQTAKFLYPERDAIELPQLAEMDFGDFEGKTIEQLKTDERFIRWVGDSLQTAPPNGESGEALARRALEGLSIVFEEMMQRKLQDVAVITHGGVIMTLLSAGAFPRRAITEWKIGNGRGYTIMITPQMWMRDHAFEVYCEIPQGADEEQEDVYRTFGLYEVNGEEEDEGEDELEYEYTEE